MKEALHCLRTELTPQHQLQLSLPPSSSHSLSSFHPSSLTPSSSEERLHKLASLVMCTDHDVLLAKAGWPGASSESRRAVLSAVREFVSADVMLPEHRYSFHSFIIYNNNNNCCC